MRSKARNQPLWNVDTWESLKKGGYLGILEDNGGPYYGFHKGHFEKTLLWGLDGFRALALVFFRFGGLGLRIQASRV